MRTSTLWLWLGAVLLSGCASGGSASSGDKRAVLKVADEEIPAEVRAIEAVVDRGGCIKADKVEIYVSRNYEWDVSLTADEVSPQKHVGGDEHVSVASGFPRVMFRNLDIRAYETITFRKSGFDVVPFIRIRAEGRAIYIEPRKDGNGFKVRHANAVLVDNENVRLVGERAAGAAAGDAPRRVHQPTGN